MKAPSVETKCVFCKKIKSGDYEISNERCVAFTPLNPVTKGHLLVVHKLHTNDFTENSQISAEVMAYASEIAALFYGEDVNLITSKGKLATQSINHLHIHLVPRTKDDGLQLPWSTQQAQMREELEGYAEDCQKLDDTFSFQKLLNIVDAKKYPLISEEL
jgi:histidine triad (HIT) family protein